MATVSLSEAVEPYVLAIDIGSSSIRTVVFDGQAQPISGTDTRSPLRLLTGPDGTAVMEPEQIRQAVYAGIDGSLKALGEHGENIAAVGMCTYVSNLIGIDAGGKRITPVITYADSRASDDAQSLRRELDESAAHQRTGCRFHSSYWTARFRWLERTQPQIFKPTTRWLTIGDYLYQDLFGRIGTSYSVASWTGLLNRFDLRWDRELLQALNIRESQLPELVDSDQAFQGLQSELAARWPALSGIPWYPAVGDGATANIGSGCADLSRVALTVGTSSAIRVVVPGRADQVPDGLWCYKIDAGHELLGGALSEGGNVYAWLKEILDFSDGDIATELANCEPDGHGLTFIPLLAGERSPGWIGSARGTIHGISLATRPSDLVRAALEGVAYRIGLVYALLEPHLDGEVTIVANGGALVNSPDWLQIIADVLGHKVTVTTAPEASSRGAGMIALRNLGVVNRLDGFPVMDGQVYEPRSERHRIYQKAMQRQQALYQRVVDTHSFDLNRRQ